MLKWALGLLAGLIAIAAAYVAILAFPSPLFAHEGVYGGFRVHSMDPLPENIDRMIAEATRRLGVMEHLRDEARYDVFLCDSPRLYYFFAFLVRLSPESLAIGLSFTENIFVNTTRVRRFAADHHPVMRHSRFEGNLAEAIAHEIAHFHSLDVLGRRAHLALPVWKSEGWAEYQANLAMIRDDPDYDLGVRIALLLNEGYWRTLPEVARDLWRWQILVEFLGEVKNYNLVDLAREEVTERRARGEMMAWYRDQSRRPSVSRASRACSSPLSMLPPATPGAFK